MGDLLDLAHLRWCSLVGRKDYLSEVVLTEFQGSVKMQPDRTARLG